MSRNVVFRHRGESALLDRVIVCSDETLIGHAVGSLLESSGVARRSRVVGSCRQVLGELRESTDVVLVFDSESEQLPDLFEAMAHRDDSTPVLVLLDRLDVERAAQVLESRAAGALERGCTVESLRRAVVDVHLGRPVFPGNRRHDVLQMLRHRRQLRYRAQSRLGRLTSRERRVLHELVRGNSVCDIAPRLAVSPHAVRACVQSLADKLGVRGQLRIAAVGRELLAAAQTSHDDPFTVAGGIRGA